MNEEKVGVFQRDESTNQSNISNLSEIKSRWIVCIRTLQQTSERIADIA